MGKKIVFCIAGTFNSGGMERVLANKANYLTKRGNEVFIVTTDQKSRPPHFLMDSRITCHDLEINYQDNNDKGLIAKTIGYIQKQKIHAERLNTLLCTLQADIAISMFDHEASLLWKINDGSKKVLEIHFSRFKRLQYGRKWFWRLMDIWRNRQDLHIARRYDRFVVLTHEDKAYWGDMPNIMVIPNANTFNPTEKSSLNNKRVIAVGRLSPQKGFDDLLDIWATIHTQCPDWKLDIYGSGELAQPLQIKIGRLGINSSVQILAPTQRIQEEYVNSAILVMTSRYEGLPMVLLEGQASGLPLVAYSCKCGPRDIIDEGKNGFLINEGDRETFGQKLKLLMQDTDLRQTMGRQAAKHAERFSQKRIMTVWENLFNHLVDN